MWARPRAPDPIMKPPCRRNMILASDLVAGKLGVTGDSPGRSPKVRAHQAAEQIIEKLCEWMQLGGKEEMVMGTIIPWEFPTLERPRFYMGEGMA